MELQSNLSSNELQVSKQFQSYLLKLKNYCQNESPIMNVSLMLHLLKFFKGQYNFYNWYSQCINNN